MDQKMPPTAGPSLVPMSGGAELVAGRIGDRRKDLAAHTGEEWPGGGRRGIDLAALALRTMAVLANGHTPQIRCDKQVRVRLLQFDGTLGTTIEDVTAIGEEGVLGRDVAVQGLTTILDVWGYDVARRDAAPVGLPQALATTARSAGNVVAFATEAASDGRIDHDEMAILKAQLKEHEDACVRLRVSIHEIEQRGGKVSEVTR
jgi:hypothetical protein